MFLQVLPLAPFHLVRETQAASNLQGPPCTPVIPAFLKSFYTFLLLLSASLPVLSPSWFTVFMT